MSKIRKWLDRRLDWLTEKGHHQKVLFLFEKLFYVWMLCMALFLFPMKEVLWSNQGLVSGVLLDDGLLNNLFLKLTYVKSSGNTIFFIHTAAILFALGGIFGGIPKFLVWITGWMLFYGAPPAFNNGYILALNMGFFLIFTFWNSKYSFRHVFNNLVWLGLIAQVILAYFESALYKYMGNTWLNGTSIWNLSHWDIYFNKGLGEFIQDHLWIGIVLTYLGLAYQSLFPFMVWSKRYKKYILMAGIGFHLFTIFFMNLPFFGSIMIISYLLFLEEKWIQQAYNRIAGFWISA